MINRIFLAGIRNLGSCPCPRCRIPLNRAHCFEMARDRSQRVSLARIDDKDRRFRITTARQHIYEKKKRVNGAAINQLLKVDSLVPTTVRTCVSSRYLYIDKLLFPRTRFLTDFQPLVSTSSPCFWSI
jgi:hypothetical protein